MGSRKFRRENKSRDQWHSEDPIREAARIGFPTGGSRCAATAASGQGADTAERAAFTAGAALMNGTLDSADRGRILASRLPLSLVRHDRSFIRCGAFIFTYAEAVRQSYFPEKYFPGRRIVL
ncbi:hypothetical protein ACFXPA_14230 [Amycolatopsis sp. NPDC059090]|uniref:hypothetical protein n=1 Tax=unclassified Amycolatopsis TaxID=2618356 RepID=UPI0036736043